MALGTSATYGTLKSREELKHLRGDDTKSTVWLKSYIFDAQAAGIVETRDGRNGVQVALVHR